MLMCSWQRRIRGGAVVGLLLAAQGVLAQETCQTATPVTIGTALIGSNAGAVTDVQAELCAPTSRDVWHTFTPSVTGLHTIALCGSSFDTVLAMYDLCGNLPIACNDDACGQQSQLVLPLTAGQPYWVRIGASGADSSGGTYRLTINGPGPSPSNNACGTPIALQPNQTIFATSVGATGTDQSNGCGTGDRGDVWFNYAPQANGPHIIEVCSTSFDTVLSVHNSCVFVQTLACSDDDSVAGCGGVGSRVVYNATVGQPFLVRVSGAGDGFGPFAITLYTARTNDVCSNAISIQTGVALAGVITPAVGTETTTSCAPSAGDVWYVYRATVSTPHTFSVCSATFDTVVSVFTGCPGTPGAVEIGCDDNGCGVGGVGASRLTVDLNVGDLYYVRVAGRVQGGAAGFGNFMILAQVTAPENDQCASALPLLAGVPVVATSSGASGNDVTSCGVNDARDVWYAFTPATGGFYEFNTCGSIIDTTMALFSDCSMQMACSDDEPGYCGASSRGSQLLRSLIGGTTYLVRIAGVNGIAGRFQLVVNRVPPSNDTCGSALAVSAGVPVSTSLNGATPSALTACVEAETADVFYTFTPSQTRAYRLDTCGSVVKVGLSVLDACGSFQQLACALDDGGQCGGLNGSAVSPVLSAGVAYIIRVAAMADEVPASFQLLITPIDAPNDICDRATVLSVDQALVATNRGASGTDITPCGMNDTRDVWFKFVAPLSGSYEVSTCAEGAVLDTSLAIFLGCPGTGGNSIVPIMCNDDDAGSCPSSIRLSRIVARLEAGQEYLIRVAGFNATEGGFVLLARYSKPANDTCAAAQNIGMGTFVYDTLGAESDPIVPDGGCGLPINQVLYDVWFRFTANSTEPFIASVCNSTFDTTMTVAMASIGCGGGQMPLIACNDDYNCDDNAATADIQSRVTFLGAAGQSYLIRVGSRSGARGAGELTVVSAGASCPCDWNGAGGLTMQDLFDFLDSWFQGQGDFNGSGQSNVGDIFDFVGCFLAPPPACGA